LATDRDALEAETVAKLKKLISFDIDPTGFGVFIGDSTDRSLKARR